MLFSIEGNIGSGKSTIVELLKKEFSEISNIPVHFVDEPVSQWETIKSAEGKNMIELFYSDQKKYAFAFQMMAYISRLSILKQAIDWGYKYIITERCLDTDKHIFCQMLYDDGFINPIEFQIYNKWFDEFITKCVYKTIYLRCDPLIAHERVMIRSRMEETISLEYLQKCHYYHDKWMKQIWDEDRNCITIDANVDMYMNPETIQDWVDIIKKMVGQAENKGDKSNFVDL